MFKCEITMYSERKFPNPNDGWDPNTFEDHGIVDTIRKTTLKELLIAVQNKYDLGAAAYYEDVRVLEIKIEDDNGNLQTYNFFLVKINQVELNAKLLLKGE